MTAVSNGNTISNKELMYVILALQSLCLRLENWSPEDEIRR